MARKKKKKKRSKFAKGLRSFAAKIGLVPKPKEDGTKPKGKASKTVEAVVYGDDGDTETVDWVVV